ncbi:hypothetical protein [Halarchaeum salinum]|uniref:Uncharacterized protein n=1 Tax=Halarchaeum salinum TaxID=489912 RepID=A0AAV3SA98_9EURY
MKPGASDPFADDETETDQEPTDDADGPAEAAETATTDATGEGDTGDAAAGNDGAGDVPSEFEFPYIYRRDKVKDERPDVHQLFVRDETDTLARDAERDLEKLLGEDVYRLDAREAIYLAGMRHLDDAADVLRSWGYDR